MSSAQEGDILHTLCVAVHSSFPPTCVVHCLRDSLSLMLVDPDHCEQGTQLLQHRLSPSSGPCKAPLPRGRSAPFSLGDRDGGPGTRWHLVMSPAPLMTGRPVTSLWFHRGLCFCEWALRALCLLFLGHLFPIDLSVFFLHFGCSLCCDPILMTSVPSRGS